MVSSATDPWGRVDEDGTVYVKTSDGERVVGSWQAGAPEEALAYFRRKYDALATDCARRLPGRTPSVTWTRWCGGSTS
jgi:hypothetical protein